ncbi:hypothetical protein CEXT_581531 [Caerostris extrusa]|uniref:Uncharacterized protein n=1 Tax=Caerostris extrusa TaxID=172846 RepID=A0AAV4NA11_CAEEX|nr:hypothetical protein CEXT_581531 [Caerostris extrusa]
MIRKGRRTASVQKKEEKKKVHKEKLPEMIISSASNQETGPGPSNWCVRDLVPFLPFPTSKRSIPISCVMRNRS